MSWNGELYGQIAMGQRAWDVLWEAGQEHGIVAGGGGAFDSLRLELRRGSLIVAVLAQLRIEQYGYTLRKALADDGLEIDEGTLYPLLRRLESQGLLVSEWREEEKRTKRFYRLSPSGKGTLKDLVAEWQDLNRSLTRIFSRRSAA